MFPVASACRPKGVKGTSDPYAALKVGISAYYKLGEAAAATRLDSTANAYDLADNNTVGQAVGVSGNAAEFTAASSQYLSRAGGVGLGGTSKFSLSWWFYHTTLAVNQTHMAQWNYASDGGFAVQTGSVSSELLVFLATAANDNGSGCHADTNGLGLAATTWYHGLLVFDGTLIGNDNRLKLYVDAVQQALTFVGSVPAAYQTPVAAFELGRFQGLGRYHNGRLDEVGIWVGRALSAGDVATLYGGGTPPSIY